MEQSKTRGQRSNLRGFLRCMAASHCRLKLPEELSEIRKSIYLTHVCIEELLSCVKLHQTSAKSQSGPEGRDGFCMFSLCAHGPKVCMRGSSQPVDKGIKKMPQLLYLDHCHWLIWFGSGSFMMRSDQCHMTSGHHPFNSKWCQLDDISLKIH